MPQSSIHKTRGVVLHQFKYSESSIIAKIYTEEFVKIIRENQTITGLGLTSDQNMANWKIKNVKGILYVDVKEQNQKTEKPGSKITPVEKDEEKESSPNTIKFK